MNFIKKGHTLCRISKMISKVEWGKDGEKTGKVVRGDCKVPTRI